MFVIIFEQKLENILDFLRLNGLGGLRTLIIAGFGNIIYINLLLYDISFIYF